MFKGIVGEFKKFIARGNVMDMAVGIIMGTAFTGIVNSIVQGVFMPFVGYLINGINFTELRIVLKPGTAESAEVAILYGSFIQQVINFIIIAIVAFALVKLLNRLQKKKEDEPAPQPAEAAPPADIALLTEIRDLLRNKENGGI